MALDHRIKDHIRLFGPMTFAEFMRRALYDPEGGYYTSDRTRIGPEGDFYTAPTTHPAFGGLLALQLERMWDLMGNPVPFQVVEGGGAKGFLAKDLLAYAARLNPGFSSAIDYRIVEGESVGQARLNTGGGLEVAWQPRLELPTIKNGVFLSNELFDAMPRHRVVKQGGQLMEIYAGLHGDEFFDDVDAPSTPDLERYFKAAGVDLPEGCKAEVDLEGPLLYAEAALKLERGYMVTIDYGYPAPHLFSEKYRQGTLLCYHKHNATKNPYIRIGRQDITAHVDFTSLAHAGDRGGMGLVDLMPQQRYLKKLGHQHFLDRLRDGGLVEEAFTANRMSLLELIRAEGMGRFGVLVQGKNVEALEPDSVVWSRAREAGAALPPALLTAEHMPLLAGRYPHLAGGMDIKNFL